MTYITRDDGEHFVIPSYRDTITAKQQSALKNEILTLSKSYGELITLQRKGPAKYEVAFSPDRGYLLGETVWSYFKQPLDMIYCEAIPGTTEAILVIVKAGSVYLDGSFPTDSIPEELVVFLTEQNNFEIYVYGDVPISQTPEDGKFSFDAASIKSFTVLDKPVFPVLPLLKAYCFELVGAVLKSHGIGAFPTKQLLTVIVGIGFAWMVWSHFFAGPEEVEAPPPPPQVNPYQGFYDTLMTPAPDAQVNLFLKELKILSTMPGWFITNANFIDGTLSASVQSPGSTLASLYDWGKINKAVANIQRDGVIVTISLPTENRPEPANIYPFRQVLARLIDRLATVYPGNNLKISEFKNQGVYWEIPVTISLNNISPALLGLIGQQLQGYPIRLQNISVSVNNGSLSGSINLMLLGS